MVSEHRLRRRVQFYETDSAGMVHFTCFFRYMEEAEHAMWREAGLSIAPEGADVGFPGSRPPSSTTGRFGSKTNSTSRFVSRP